MTSYNISLCISISPLFEGKLIVCYDDNLITIDGSTELSFTEDVNARYLSYGWHVQTVDDANDIPSLRCVCVSMSVCVCV